MQYGSMQTYLDLLCVDSHSNCTQIVEEHGCWGAVDYVVNVSLLCPDTCNFCYQSSDASGDSTDDMHAAVIVSVIAGCCIIAGVVQFIFLLQGGESNSFQSLNVQRRRGQQPFN